MYSIKLQFEDNTGIRQEHISLLNYALTDESPSIAIPF